MTKPKRTSTFGLSSEKISQLLAMDAEDGQSNPEPSERDIRAEMLHEMLAETLSLHEVEPIRSSRTQTQMSHTIADLAGEPIGALLFDPATDLPVLRRIKDYGRQRAKSVKPKSAKPGPQEQVAITVYYAAIAASLVFHGTLITSTSYAELNKSFHRLLREPWITEPLTELFQESAKIAEERAAP